MHKMESKRDMQNMSEDKYGSTLPLDIAECKRSNIMVSGTNSTGKSLTAMSISDILMANNWQVLVFDSSGIWKQKSSIPWFYMVSETTLKYILPTHGSLIYDTSLLLPSYQRQFIEWVLNDVWKMKVQQKPKPWTLIVLEEAQLYMRNIKGMVSQNLMRVCSVGRNQHVRLLAISPSHVGLDTEFRRLAQQRYIFKIGNENNTKRRFSSVYSKDWFRVAKHLDIGFCIYYLNERMKVYKIPLFQSNVKPMAYREPQKPKPKGIIHRILTAINGSEEPDLDEDSDEWEEGEGYPIFDEEFV